MKKTKRLVVIPSDPIADYEQKGLCALETYYNPTHFFDEVYVLSPVETEQRFVHGMHIIPVSPRNFRSKLKEIQPNVVRAYGGFWACDLACYNKLKNIPVVVSLHDTDPKRFFPSLQYADLVICMSKAVAQVAINKGIATDKIRIMPNRVDLTRFYPLDNNILERKPYENYPEGKFILHIGRKTKQKNLDTLLKALPHLPNNYFTVFIGMGDAISYQRLAASLNVEQRCFWINAIPNNELALWLHHCDCFCTPSRWEGFGIVFIEAAASGAAIVTSDISPMNEYLTHMETAFLVKDYEDPHALASGILTVCSNLSLNQKLKLNAPNAAKPFDKETVDKLEVAIYKEVIEKGSQQLPSFLSDPSYIKFKCKNSFTYSLLRQCKNNIKKIFQKQ